MYYGPNLLSDAGFGGGSNTSLLLSMTFLGSINIIGQLAFLMVSDKYGRRELILKCMPILALC